MEETLEQIITSFSGICPLWSEDVWSALQSQKFNDAERSLQNILYRMAPEAWSAVYWIGIAEGIPAFRGELGMDIWARQALPSIGKAFFKAGSPIKILAAYTSVDLDLLGEFHTFLINSIPGTDELSKINWLKENVDPLVVTFFLANPLGLNFSGATISQDQISRLKSLPESIKNTIFSIQTPEIIKKIVDQNNIPQEKLGRIAILVGSVLLGFVHEEELPAEISKRTGIPAIAGKSLFESFNTRIFRPIQSDIDKVYAPLPHEEITTIQTSSNGPKIIQDVAVSVPTAPKPMASTSTATSQTINGMPTLNSSAIPNANIVPAAPQNNRLSDIGWSKSRSSDPVVKLDISQVPASATTTAPKPVAAPSAPSTPINPALGEFERLSAMKKAQTPQPATGHEPAPFILHEDTSFSAAPKNADFKMSQPQTSADMHLGSFKSQSTIRPAVLEFGDKSNAAVPKPPTPSPAGSVVHYTEFQQSLSKTPAQNSGPRQVSQVTAPSIPKPPQSQVAFTAPAASLPPRPPMPKISPTIPASNTAATLAGSEKEKVIIKDFL